MGDPIIKEVYYKGEVVAYIEEMICGWDVVENNVLVFNETEKSKEAQQCMKDNTLALGRERRIIPADMRRIKDKDVAVFNRVGENTYTLVEKYINI